VTRDARTAGGDAPLVSVVVIVRDGERFLGEALESIAAQTIGDWEAIVVDDGSGDATISIAERFAARDPRFRLARHAGGANRGMSASRNLGRRHARGRFVTFLDHDDRMEPAKLARQVEILEAHPIACAVVTPNLRWHSWRDGGTNEIQDSDEIQDLGVPPGVHAPPSLLPAFLARTSATPQSPLIRCEAFDAVGGYEESFVAMYEDQVFFAKLLLLAPVVVGTEPMHRYRQHGESCVSLSHRAGAQRRARRQFLQWLARYLAAHRPGDRGLRALVSREWRRSWLASLLGVIRRGR
jgi:glycosyltransferase involved in cell wall biosynthesis